jgi:hypothetical protein
MENTTKHPDEPESLLPEKVVCAFGEIPYNEFKTHYADIYAQVEDATHLLTGRTTHEFKMATLPLEVQSLRPTEQALLMDFFPTSLEQKDSARQIATYELYKVAACLKSAGDTSYPALQTRVNTTPEEFIKSLEASAEAVNSMDPALVSFISNVYEDVGRAKQLAFVEISSRP